MKPNASVIASIALLSSFSYVMAEEGLDVIDGTNIADKDDYVFKKDETNEANNEFNEANHEEEYQEEYEEEHGEEYQEEYEDAESEDKNEADPKDYTEYESDGTETESESPKYVYIDGLKLTFSILAGLAILFVI
jgi:hypothetical protein